MDNKMRDNDFTILDTVMKEISAKYQESINFFERNIKSKYNFLDFSTNILNDKIEIYYYSNQYINNEICIVKYSFSKRDNGSGWKFGTKIYNEKISDLSIEEYDKIIKNIPSLESLNLIIRTKEKRPSNLRRRSRPDKFSLNFDKIKSELYLKYFSLKNKYIKITDINEIKYKISSVLIEFYFIKNLYLKEKKIGEIIIRNYSNILNEREIDFEIKYLKDIVSSFSKSNQYILRNNYFLSNILPHFEKILVSDNDLIYNYYKKNILVFNQEKLQIEDIRDCCYKTVASIQQQAKSIINEDFIKI